MLHYARTSIQSTYPIRNPLQRTRSELIRLLLSAEAGGPTPTTEEIRSYQKENLGREGGMDCILDLRSAARLKAITRSKTGK